MRALVVHNSYSGKNKASKKLEYILKVLKTKYYIVDFFQSFSATSIKECLDFDHHDYDLVLAIGGDGTIHEVVNAIMKSNKRPKVAYLPNGTCNDSAKTLGLRRNLKRNLKRILNGESKPIDIYKINDDYFVYGLACGSLTEISYDADHNFKRNLGKLAYYIEGVKQLKKTKTVDIDIEYDNKHITGNFSLFLAVNTRYLAGFKLHRKERIYLDDGYITITLIKKTNKLMNIIDFGMFLLIGDNYKHNITTFTAKNFKIKSDSLINYNTDGENYGAHRKVEIECMPKALEVILAKRVNRRHFLK